MSHMEGKAKQRFWRFGSAFFFFSTRMVWRFTPDYDVFKCKAAFAFLRVVVDKIVNAMRSRLHAVRKTAYALNPRV